MLGFPNRRAARSRSTELDDRIRCVLHIGTEKTGTTVLQEWLYSNRSALSSQGVYLSENLGVPNNRLLPAYFASRLDDWAKWERISTLEEKDRFFDGFLSGLSEEIAKAAGSHDVFVISSEHLHSRLLERHEVERLHEFLTANFDEIEVVCYFRNQFDVAVSLYSTALKVETTKTLADLIDEVRPERYYYNYAQIADRWSDIFGRENCNFRIYDRARFVERDIRKDFMSVVDPGLDLASLDYTVETANESLSALEGAAFRAVNTKVPHWLPGNGGRNPLNRRVKTELDKIEALKVGKITSDNRSEVLERFRQSNEDFFRTYFGTGNEFAPAEGKAGGQETFDLAQVQSIVEQLLDVVLGFVGVRLSDRSIDGLRDLALKIERGDEPTLKDALFLMELAQASRPGGVLINAKVADWTSRLAQDPARKGRTSGSE